MLALLKTLFDELRDKGVSYCHWKSNATLEEALNGKGDLDLLVAQFQWDSFTGVLERLKFKPVSEPAWARHPGIAHFYGLDDDSGRVVHLHIYRKLVTGGHWIKNFRFPLEEELLRNARTLRSIKVPQAGSELVLLIVRRMAGCRFLADALMAEREWPAMQNELKWLQEECPLEEALPILDRYFPEIGPDLFRRSLRLLETRGSLLRKWREGARVARRLRKYRRHGGVVARILLIHRVACTVFNKFCRRRNPKRFARGGLVVAVVGRDASGKSTLVDSLRKFFAKRVETWTAHVGTPLPNVVTFFTDIVGPATRKLHGKMASSGMKGSGSATWPRRFWWLILALRRRSLLKRLRRLSLKGAIVITDRYCSTFPGSIDGPKIEAGIGGNGGSPLLKKVAFIENRIYESCPQADIVIELSSNEETQLARNTQRNKKGKKGQDYMLNRLKQPFVPATGRMGTFSIDNSSSFEVTLARAKRITWDHLR